MKIAICIPCHGNAKAQFVGSICALVAETVKSGHEVQTIVYSSSRISASRNTLVFEALKTEPDFLLWIDDDHSFLPDTAIKLMARDLDAVGANIPTRGIPPAPTARIDGKPVYTTRVKAEAAEIKQVDAMGFGLCLIKAEVFRTLGAPWFKSDQGEYGGMGEDYYFFARLKQAGIPAFVDHAVSWGVGHVHQVVLTNEHVTPP